MGNCDRRLIGYKVIDLLEKNGITEKLTEYNKILGDEMDKFNIKPEQFILSPMEREEIANKIYKNMKEMVGKNG